MSAVIPTHNRPTELLRAVHSVLHQSFPGEVECLVVFDREEPYVPDVSVPELRSVRAVANSRRPGLPGARNTGIDAANGSLVAFLDDDDEWMPDKLARQVGLLEATPEAVAATCGAMFHRGRRVFSRVPTPVVQHEQLLQSRFMVVHSSTLVFRRRALVDEIGLVDEEIPGGFGEDYDLLLRTTAVAPMVAVTEPLVRIQWGGSYFIGRWEMLVPALQYLIAKHPELLDHGRNASRMLGRLAFALVAQGQRRKAFHYARRSIRLNVRQARGYLTLIALAGVPAGAIARLMHAIGRPI